MFPRFWVLLTSKQRLRFKNNSTIYQSHRSTSSLTVEDLEKKPRKVVEIVTPLENQSVKYGEPLELSVKGTKEDRTG